MTTEADKITAELMALAERFAYHSALINETHIETRDALEQAIRRAVDWGEPVAWRHKSDHTQLRHIGPCTDYMEPHLEPLYARSQA